MLRSCYVFIDFSSFISQKHFIEIIANHKIFNHFCALSNGATRFSIRATHKIAIFFVIRVLTMGMWVMMMEAGAHGIVCCVCVMGVGVKCKMCKMGVGVRYSEEENVYLGVGVKNLAEKIVKIGKNWVGRYIFRRFTKIYHTFQQFFPDPDWSKPDSISWFSPLSSIIYHLSSIIYHLSSIIYHLSISHFS